MSTYKLYTDWTAWRPLAHAPEGCAALRSPFWLPAAQGQHREDAV
jgi:hypothetical protein